MIELKLEIKWIYLITYAFVKFLLDSVKYFSNVKKLLWLNKGWDFGVGESSLQSSKKATVVLSE